MLTQIDFTVRFERNSTAKDRHVCHVDKLKGKRTKISFSKYERSVNYIQVLSFLCFQHKQCFPLSIVNAFLHLLDDSCF